MKRVEINSKEDNRQRIQKLTRDIDRFIQKGDYGFKFNFTIRDNSYWDNPEERINNHWREVGYWHILPCWEYRIELKKYYQGTYKLPVYLSLNGELDKYLKDEEFLNKQFNQLDGKRVVTLKRALFDTQDKITSVGNYINEFWRTQRKWFIRYVDKNSEDVIHYEYDEFTHGRQEELGRAEDAFYGSMLGDKYAIRWLLVDILDERKVTEYWELTSKLLRLAKKYLALQIAIKHRRSKSTKPKIYDAKELFENFNERLSQMEINHENIKTIFRELEPGVILDPSKNYVFKSSGNINKDSVANELAKIFEIQEDKSITPKTIKEAYKKDWDKMT